MTKHGKHFVEALEERHLLATISGQLWHDSNASGFVDATESFVGMPSIGMEVLTNESVWRSKLTDIQVEDFDQIPLNELFAAFPPNTPHSLGEFEFQYVGGTGFLGLFPSITEGIGRGNRVFSGEVSDDATPGAHTFQLPRPSTAVGFELLGATDEGGLVITANNQSWLVNDVLADGSNFFGIVSDTPISSFSIDIATSGNEFFDLDNLQIGNVADRRIELLDSNAAVLETAVARNIDQNNDGQISRSEMGIYSFDVPTGNYQLRQVLPTDWFASTQVPLSVTVNNVNQEISGLNLGSFQNGTVSGRIWNDTKANGFRDADEIYLNQWTVELVDANEQVIATTQTSSVDLNGDRQFDPEFEDGIFRFADVRPGNYRVRVVTENGWMVTTEEAAASRFVMSQQNIEDVHFGVVREEQIQNSVLSGRVWNDLNANGIREFNEPYLDNWTLELRDESGQFVRFQISSSFDLDNDGEINPATEMGRYAFRELPPETFTIDIVRPQGWIVTSPNSSQFARTLENNERINDLDFGVILQSELPVSTIRGQVYLDANKNSLLDSDEGAIISNAADNDFETFGSLEAWSSNVENSVLEDLSNVPVNPLFSAFEADSLHQLGEVQFRYEGGPGFLGFFPAIISDFATGNRLLTTEISPAGRPGVHEIVLPRPVTAFAADFVNATDQVGLQMNFGNQTVSLSEIQIEGSSFAGIVASNPFEKITLTLPETADVSEVFDLDNFRFGDSINAGGDGAVTTLLDLLNESGEVIATTETRSIDLDNDGTIDNGEMAAYEFTDVRAGSYSVAARFGDNLIQTEPLGSTFSIDVVAENDIANLNFGAVPTDQDNLAGRAIRLQDPIEAIRFTLTPDLPIETNELRLVYHADSSEVFDLTADGIDVVQDNNGFLVTGVNLEPSGIYELQVEREDTVLSVQNTTRMSDQVVRWLVNPGDSNRDGVFNPTDLIISFQTTKFETGERATWRQGDWNGDGIFSTADLVTSFEAGTYQSSARISASIVDLAFADLFVDSHEQKENRARRFESL